MHTLYLRLNVSNVRNSHISLHNSKLIYTFEKIANQQWLNKRED